MELVQIGVIHTPFNESSGTPIQPSYGSNAKGEVEVYEQYADGLDDIDGFERIWLVFGADRARKPRLKVIPYRDTVERGVFSTRSPSRPNSICISPVRLIKRRDNFLEIEGVDMLDGSPLYDIKPYIAAVDAYPDSAGGWFEEVRGEERGDVTRADERFGSGK
jgi:tRNA-Thr(GGU) m(6)t(6)A37 methyltransferase TsaA